MPMADREAIHPIRTGMGFGAMRFAASGDIFWTASATSRLRSGEREHLSRAIEATGNILHYVLIRGCYLPGGSVWTNVEPS